MSEMEGYNGFSSVIKSLLNIFFNRFCGVKLRRAKRESIRIDSYSLKMEAECVGVKVGVLLGDEKVLALAGVVGEVRERLRNLARNKETTLSDLQKSQMNLCDQIRDEFLPPLGIRLEDHDQGAPTIKLVDADELLKEIEEKKNAEAGKKAEKERKKAEAAAKREASLKEEVKDPLTMFQTDEYSSWSENGLPTHDKDGKEITKSQLKKLTKLMEAQKKKYEKWRGLHNNCNNTRFSTLLHLCHHLYS
ncbi:Cysteine--tRNA ligase, cytoplasmic [Armadillidium vulgare]|nr:Cysteine--tRNA ligase, cytoplasmic [Armadillidium vulgare]